MSVVLFQIKWLRCKEDLVYFVVVGEITAFNRWHHPTNLMCLSYVIELFDQLLGFSSHVNIQSYKYSFSNGTGLSQYNCKCVKCSWLENIVLFRRTTHFDHFSANSGYELVNRLNISIHSQEFWAFVIQHRKKIMQIRRTSWKLSWSSDSNAINLSLSFVRLWCKGNLRACMCSCTALLCHVKHAAIISKG